MHLTCRYGGGPVDDRETEKYIDKLYDALSFVQYLEKLHYSRLVVVGGNH